MSDEAKDQAVRELLRQILAALQRIEQALVTPPPTAR